MRIRSIDRPLMVAGMLCVSLVVAGDRVLGQEQSVQARMSAAWRLNTDMSSTPPTQPSLDPKSDKQDNGVSGGSGGSGGTDASLFLADRTRMVLMQELTEVPAQLAITATVDGMTCTDGFGVSHKFAATGKFEKLTFSSGKPQFRTRWVRNTLTQDIKDDGIDLVRTFDVSPDGQQLVITLTIRTQPDPQAMKRQGNTPSTLRFVYDRAR